MVNVRMYRNVARHIPDVPASAQWYRRIIGRARRHVPAIPSALSIALVDDDEMRTLNRQSRNLDKITDVLSFLYEPNEGEIIVCVPQAMRQYARFKSASIREELCRLMVHGALHLAGYDHTQRNERLLMESMTKKILNSLSESGEGQ